MSNQEVQAPRSLNPTLYVAGRRVIASGTVVARASDAISIFPFDSPSNTYQIAIEFYVNPLLPSVINSSVSDYGYRIVFQNMERSQGVSNASPIYVANYLGRLIYASIGFYMIGSGPAASRVVHYTFYDGGPTALENNSGADK